MGWANVRLIAAYRPTQKVKFAAWPTSWRPPGTDRLLSRWSKVNSRIWLRHIDSTINIVLGIIIILFYTYHSVWGLNRWLDDSGCLKVEQFQMTQWSQFAWWQEAVTIAQKCRLLTSLLTNNFVSAPYQKTFKKGFKPFLFKLPVLIFFVSGPEAFGLSQGQTGSPNWPWLSRKTGPAPSAVA